MSIKELAIKLFRSNCVLFGKFKLTSGLISPYYIDLRKVPSYPNLFKEVIKAYVEHVSKLDPETIAGIATAGLPIASVVAYELNLPLVYVRKEAREHGTGRVVEGVVKEGSKTVVIDDVATTGGSIVTAANELRRLGADVKYAVVLIDREQGAKEELRKLGIELRSVMRVTELIEALRNEGLINERTYEEVINYVRRWGVHGV